MYVTKGETFKDTDVTSQQHNKMSRVQIIKDSL